jgi:UDP-N-acetylmuramoyl-tripeptide--D-alanyl-D-alanine ligase
MTIQPLWTAADLAQAMGVAVDGQIAVSGVSIDSRTCQPGDLFVALNGPGLARDGHDFVAGALAKGAAAALVSRAPSGVSTDPRLVRVADTQAALENLGRARRKASAAKVIAVTGSVGKTGTKEALRHVLARQGATHASAASYNNLWGVPLSLARMPVDSQFAVFEIGMNHAGEIRPLTKQVRPHVAIITTIEPVHIEFFDSIEGIADAKAEIFEGLDHGTAILNRDNPHFARLKAAAERCGAMRILSFGMDAPADIRLAKFSGDALGSSVEITMGAKTLSGWIGQPGRHIAQNALAVLAAVAESGGDPAQALKDLSDLGAVDGRGRRHILPWGAGTLTLIDDSYNASPPSVRAALGLMDLVADQAQTGRRIAVLGDMRELGAASDDMHRDLADAVGTHADLLFACGVHMRALYDAVAPEKRGAFAPDSRALAPILRDQLRAHDIVLVKGSLGSAMGLIVQDLVAEGRV